MDRRCNQMGAGAFERSGLCGNVDGSGEAVSGENKSCCSGIFQLTQLSAATKRVSRLILDRGRHRIPLRPAIGLQNLFAQAQALRRYFYQFIFIDKLDRLLQILRLERHQSNRIVR
jgi:hypothetical protein